MVLVTLYFMTKNLFSLMFAMENYNVHKKRLKQLKFQKKQDMDSAELVDMITKPAIKYILPRLKPKDLEQLTHDLRMAKWDKNMTAVQFRALSLTLKIVGILMFLILKNASLIFALVWGVVLVFGIDVLFNNSLSNRKTKLLSDFPDFIRITEGYLSAGMPFAEAVSKSIKYVGPEWQPILQKFVVECSTRSINDALDTLKKDIDMFEVREFVALVKLTLEQGGDAKDGFSAQADKIRDIQLDMIALKIGRRQMFGIAIQAPLLICNLLVFSLPTISAMTSLSSM